MRASKLAWEPVAWLSLECLASTQKEKPKGWCQEAGLSSAGFSAFRVPWPVYGTMNTDTSRFRHSNHLFKCPQNARSSDILWGPKHKMMAFAFKKPMVLVQRESGTK